MQTKVAFITGSAKRIGAYTAAYLHEKGFNVVIHCNQSLQEANDLATTLNKTRAFSAKVVQGDLTRIEALSTIAEQATQAFGRLDVLINNASAFYPTPMGHITEQDWRCLFASNAQAPLFLTQLCKKQLEANQGVVVNMVDIHAQRPLKSHTVYCMAKAALVTMTQSLAQELAPDVRVNGIAPGAILWPSEALQESEKNHILRQIPLQKMGTEKDIAQAIAFLIDAPYITGQILAVDGGRSIANPHSA
ncbi:MAG: pteridine reductase [Aliiglaciecola sp.]